MTMNVPTVLYIQCTKDQYESILEHRELKECLQLPDPEMAVIILLLYQRFSCEFHLTMSKGKFPEG